MTNKELKQLRESKGLTQTQAGELIGRSKRTIIRLEQDDNYNLDRIVKEAYIRKLKECE